MSAVERADVTIIGLDDAQTWHDGCCNGGIQKDSHFITDKRQWGCGTGRFSIAKYLVSIE